MKLVSVLVQVIAGTAGVSPAVSAAGANSFPTKWIASFSIMLSSSRACAIVSESSAEGSHNGSAAVLKTAVRKDMQVRVLSPPPSFTSTQGSQSLLGGADLLVTLLLHNLKGSEAQESPIKDVQVDDRDDKADRDLYMGHWYGRKC